MQRSRSTRIDDLAALGRELPEQHLALAAGGARRRTNKLDCSKLGEMIVCQFIQD